MPGTPGDVVGGVALEADEVGDLGGVDAVALADPLGGVDDHVGDAARRHHDADVVGGQLEGVAIGRDDADAVAVALGHGGQGADHVVGLHPLDADVAVAEGLDQRREEGALGLEQRRGGLAVGLVLGIELEPLGGALVPGHDHAGGAVVGQHPHQHVGHAQQRVGGLALGGLQLLGQGVEGAVGEAVAVYQEDVAGLGGRVVEVEIRRLGLLRGRHRASVDDWGGRPSLRAARPGNRARSGRTPVGAPCWARGRRPRCARDGLRGSRG